MKKVPPFDSYHDTSGKTCPSCHQYKLYVSRSTFIYNFAPRYSMLGCYMPGHFLDRCYDCIDLARTEKGLPLMVRKTLLRHSLREVVGKHSSLRRDDRKEIYNADQWEPKVEREQGERLMTKVKERLKERGEI